MSARGSRRSRELPAWARLALVGILAVLALAVPVERAQAQWIAFRSVPPNPFSGTTYPVHVQFYGEHGAMFCESFCYYYDDTVYPETFTFTVNGSNVGLTVMEWENYCQWDGPYGDYVCVASYNANGSPQLYFPGQTSTLVASVDSWGASGTVPISTSYQYTSTTPVYAVQTTPDGAVLTPTAGTNGTYNFTVRNSGDTQTTYSVNAQCSGAALVSCTMSPFSVTLAAGQTATATVAYAIGQAGTTGRMRVTAAGNGVQDSGWVNVSVPATYGVAVTPDNGTAGPTGNSSHSQPFDVRNVGNASASFNLAVSCAGPGIVAGSCTIPSSIVTVAQGGSVPVTVSYRTAAALGVSGTITLRATHATQPTVTDTGRVNVTTSLVDGVAVEVTSLNPGTTIEREQCLAFALWPDLANQCGVLRITHPLPSVRTDNTTRTPTLVYYTDHIHPPRLLANITLPAGMAADSVRIIVRDNTPEAKEVARRTYAGSYWQNGRAMRVNVANYYPWRNRGTGAYRYLVEVSRLTGGQWQLVHVPVAGEYAAVNRLDSPFGPGWWLAGFEKLYLGQPGGGILWVGGDGSTRLYQPDAVQPNVYRAAAVDRPDSLVQVTGGAARWIRHLPHGAKVTFDSLGRHVTTENRLGRVTRFVYQTANPNLLDRLELPPAAAGLTYRFVYDTRGRLIRIDSPGATGVLATVLHRNKTRADSMPVIDSIVDPDLTVVRFRHASWGPAIDARTDRNGNSVYVIGRGHSPAMANAHQYLTSTSLIVHSFRTADGLGALPTDPPVSADSADFLYNGPRTDVTDLTTFWLNTLGAPTRIVNALGHETQLEHGDQRWPGLVTRVQRPNGFTTTATYDGRGNLESTTALNPFGDGRHATTTYTWDPKWDFVTRVRSQEGVGSDMQYDPTTGNRLYVQDARGDTTRVTFGYTTDGLLETVQRPGVTGVERYTYDALRNVDATISVLGRQSAFRNDAIGRTWRVETPVDMAGTQVQSTSTVYDVWSRPTQVTTASTAANTPSLVVTNFYDAEGRLDSLWRATQPATNVDVLRTFWTYDRAGRKVSERQGGDAGAESFAYDEAGNLLTQTTRRGHVISMQYDALNRLTQRTVPAASYAESPEGSWSFPLYTNGLTIPADVSTFSYDAAGALLTANNGDAQVKRSYYPNGLLKTDSLRIRTWTGTDFTQHVYGMRSAYDLDGRRTRLWHPAQLVPHNPYVPAVDSVVYAYDAGGQLDTVVDLANRTFVYRYDALGHLRELSKPGQVHESFTYDADGALRERFGRVTWPGWPVDSLYHDLLTYDARGKVIVANTMLDTVTFRYDGLGALTYRESFIKPVGQGAERRETYQPDALGNVSTSGVSGDFANLSTQHWYQRTTGRVVRTSAGGGGSAEADTTTYDAAGNVRRVDRYQAAYILGDSTTTGILRATTYNYYDAAQRLRVTDKRTAAGAALYFPIASLGAFEEYRYDALGRRVLMRSRRDSVGGLDGIIERYVWDGDQLLYEMRYDGADRVSAANLERDTVTVYRITPCELRKNCGWGPEDPPEYRPDSVEYNPFYGRVAYTHGLGIDRPLSITRMGFGRDSVLFSAFTINPYENWQGYHAGATYGGGSTVSENGVSFHLPTELHWPARSSLAYLRFENWENRRSWMGGLMQQQRSPAGMLYMRNRYYDPVAGRFTQEDPIGFAGGMNLYGFAAGDPVNHSDPFGLKDCKKDDKVCNSLQSAAKWAARILGSNRSVRGRLPGDSRQIDLSRYGVAVRGRVLSNTQFAIQARGSGQSTVGVRGHVQIDDIPTVQYVIVKEGEVDLPEGDFRVTGYTWAGSFSAEGNIQTGDYQASGPLGFSLQGNLWRPRTPPATSYPDFTALCLQIGACQ